MTAASRKAGRARLASGGMSDYYQAVRPRQCVGCLGPIRAGEFFTRGAPGASNAVCATCEPFEAAAGR